VEGQRSRNGRDAQRERRNERARRPHFTASQNGGVRRGEELTDALVVDALEEWSNSLVGNSEHSAKRSGILHRPRDHQRDLRIVDRADGVVNEVDPFVVAQRAEAETRECTWTYPQLTPDVGPRATRWVHTHMGAVPDGLDPTRVTTELGASPLARRDVVSEDEIAASGKQATAEAVHPPADRAGRSRERLRRIDLVDRPDEAIPSKRAAAMRPANAGSLSHERIHWKPGAGG
jgi:hypothetical protein